MRRALASLAVLTLAGAATAEEYKQIRKHEVYLGARWDVGSTWTYGIAPEYSFTRIEESRWGGLLRATIGLEAQLHSEDVDTIDAFALAIPGRLDMAGHGGLFGFETTLAYSPDEAQLLGNVGVFVTFLYVDVGYSFYFPLGPFEYDDWLGAHRFSVRVQIPIFGLSRSETTREISP